MCVCVVCWTSGDHSNTAAECGGAWGLYMQCECVWQSDLPLGGWGHMDVMGQKS